MAYSFICSCWLLAAIYQLIPTQDILVGGLLAFTSDFLCCTIIRFGNARGLSLLEFHYCSTKRIAIDRQSIDPDLSGGFDRITISDTLLHFSQIGSEPYSACSPKSLYLF